jgi:hypothetical protein
VFAQKMGLCSRCSIENAQGKLAHAQFPVIHEREEVEDIWGQNLVKGGRRVNKGVSDRGQNGCTSSGIRITNAGVNLWQVSRRVSGDEFANASSSDAARALVCAFGVFEERSPQRVRKIL